MLEGVARIAILGSFPELPPGSSSEYLLSVPLVAVAAPEHPLAKIKGPVPRSEAARHVQLILTDRSELTAGRQYGVFNPNGWRLADLGAKHAFLRAGLGFGGIPALMVERDIAEGALVELAIEDMPPESLFLTMSAAWRIDAPPGPAGRWFIDRAKAVTAQCPEGR